MGNCQLEKTTVNRGETETISHVTLSCSHYLFIYIILNVNQIHLHDVWFQNNPGQNNPGQLNICVCISLSVYSNAQTTPFRIYGKPYAHNFCAVDILRSIATRQAISSVPKFYDMLGRGFRIQRMNIVKVKWDHKHC